MSVPKDQTRIETPDRSVEQVAEKAAAKKNGNGNVAWVNREWLAALASALLLLGGIAIDQIFHARWFDHYARLLWYVVAYIPVGLPVIHKGVKLALKGDVFTEFFLMGIATIGAFYISEYPEGVAVMLFYAVGELLQGAAVSRAKKNIKALLDVRPATASVVRNGSLVATAPVDVKVGDRLHVKVGERVALDGKMITDESSFNTAALTGESTPRTYLKGDTVLAGMINEGKVIELSVTRLFEDSALSRILALVQNAQGRKAKTELFIRKFARYYTPVVVFLAIALTFLPFFFVDVYDFKTWLYRALIFLVISCPCALVVAIPLGYFGGIGAGSRNGILFKGSSYLDRITRLGAIVFDKTGTLTKGTFAVTKIVEAIPKDEWLSLVAALESYSNHPIAKVIAQLGASNRFNVSSVEEFRGQGIKGVVDGKEVVAGNASLFDRFNLTHTSVEDDHATTVWVSVNGKYAGYILISDEIKTDSVAAIAQLHDMNIKTAVLSGDKNKLTLNVAQQLGIPVSYGDLLPEDKVTRFEEIKKGKSYATAFVGDGINDAPVIAISDIGIAMGGMGSDAAIETSDVVIQTDQLSKIVTAIKIGRATRAIIWQNIALAFAVKFIVMTIGAVGSATMWEAVFADVGVALLAIANAIRIQHMKF